VRARIAWCVAGLAAVAALLDTLFTAAHLALLSEATVADHGWPLITLAGVGCAFMGALIVSRLPRQPLGWLLCTAGLISVTLAAEAYGDWVLEGDGPGSPYWAHVAGWAGSLLGWPAFTAIIMVFLFAPDGHLLSPRWRWAAWISLVGLGLHTVGTLTISPGQFVQGEQYGTSSVSAPILSVGVALVAAGLVASLVSLVLRLRRATDDVRRQLLWIASSAAFLAFGVMVVLVVPQIQGQEKSWLAALPLGFAQLAFPVCVAVAVLRHRLVDIDLIVNRTLVLGLATGVVGAGYVLVVVVVGLVVGGGTGRLWPSLFATAFVAIAFQPLRRRVVTVADRLAFGAAAAPYEALATFSRRLGDVPDPAALLPAMAEAAARAVNASSARVVLHVDAGPDQAAIWPPSGSEDFADTDVEQQVVDRGERLGSITVAMPAGRPLRARERQLLADLAAQARMAFRNARLTAERTRQVHELREHARDLDESRRRLIDARDAERSRLERAIGHQVVLHLAPIPPRLRELSHFDGEPAAVVDAAKLGPLVESLTDALEALRELTRGVFPAQLARSGLPVALGSLLARTAGSRRLLVDHSVATRRFDTDVEGAAYFCAVEAVRELTPPVAVVLTLAGDQLTLLVRGTKRTGLPLGHMRDRVESAGGVVSMTSQGDHAVVEVRLPVLAPVQAVAS